MAEPESLATEETVQKHIRRHAYDRLIMLCDGIFAIATTLSALEIHLPEDAASFGEVTRAVGKPLFAYDETALIAETLAMFYEERKKAAC